MTTATAPAASPKFTLAQRYPYYLANRAVQANEDLEVTNKYTGKVATRVALADAAVIDEAIAKAVACFAELRRWPAFRRKAVLRHMVDRMTERAEEMAVALAIEAGKPINDARGEVTRGIDTFTLAMEESTRLYGEVQPLDISPRAAGYQSIWKRVPIGPCSFISPFNFPINLAAHKIAPALAVGCPFVLKPASRTPLGAIIMGEILAETDLPEGAFSILPRSRDGADLFTTDERLKLLSFTGSPEVGWALKARAGKKPVILELGGNAACIVDKDADLERATDRLIVGAFYQSGQSCIGVQRILGHRAIYDDLRTMLRDKTARLEAGDPLDERTFLGPLISEGDAKRLETWVNDAVQRGAKVLVGGTRDGVFYDATIVEDVPRDAKLSCDEAFGPVATLAPFDDFDEALARVNDSVFGLQAGVFTRDIHHAFRAFDELEVGGVVINDVPSMRVDSMPYGGVKDSGLGREGIRFAMEDMTEIRLMVMKDIGTAPQPQRPRGGGRMIAFAMDDEAFLSSFEDLSLPFDRWDHRAHVKVAFLYLRAHPFDDAVERVRRGIERYNAHNDVPDEPTRGYHETMTVAFMTIIHAVMNAHGAAFPAETADAFCDAHPQLLVRQILRLFYTPERFLDPEAKVRFLEPDLARLPLGRGAEAIVMNRPASLAVVAALVLGVCHGCASIEPPALGGIYNDAARHHGPGVNPVIVIPGVLGTRLRDSESGTVVWGAFSGDYANPERPAGARLVAVPMREGAADDGVEPDGALDRLRLNLLFVPVELSAYLEILATLGAGGYRDDGLGTSGAVDYGTDHYTCFQFGYDWRRDNIENARRLGRFIEEKQRYVAERYDVAPEEVKFDIVAHSMGGLLTRYFLRYGDAEPGPDGTPPPVEWSGAKSVERVIMVGTPNAGSADAVVQLIDGAKFAFFLPRYDPAVLGTMPALYQLLPRPEHGAVRDHATGAPIDILDPAVWRERGWGLAAPDQARVLERLLPDVADPAERRRIALEHQARCLDRARAFFAALDVPAVPPPSLELSLFAGDAVPTAAVIEVKHGRPRVASRGPGDGSVLRSSALMDQRAAGGWQRHLVSPIAWDDVSFLFTDHIGLTKDAVFSDNVLYKLLEEPRPWRR